MNHNEVSRVNKLSAQNGKYHTDYYRSNNAKLVKRENLEKTSW
jgi:hypothetical protein